MLQWNYTVPEIRRPITEFWLTKQDTSLSVVLAEPGAETLDPNFLVFSENHYKYSV